MSRLIESIRLCNGTFRNLRYHQQRMNRAFAALFPGIQPWSIEQLLMKQPFPLNGLFKCRIFYDHQSASIEYVEYTFPLIRTLQVVVADNLRYEHKFENRSEINALFGQRGQADDVLIVRNRLVADTSFANIVFRKGPKWFTPSACLLSGVMREVLLEQSLIETREIPLAEIRHYDAFKLINAMVGFDLEEQSVSNIF